jgi:LPS-assembly lipoprotein
LKRCAHPPPPAPPFGTGPLHPVPAAAPWWRRERAAAALALAAALLLCGCGFTPLYGQRDDKTSVTGEMAQVYVMPIPNRLGQVLYNELRDRIVPDGQPASPKYVLTVQVAQSFQNTVIRPDATASRLNLIMRASYVLYDAPTRKPLTRGVAESIGAYSVRVDPYPTLVARMDVQTRVARDLSDELRNRIAVYFTAPGKVPLPKEAPQRVPPMSPEIGTGRLGAGTVETGVFGNLPGPAGPAGTLEQGTIDQPPGTYSQ